jgi:hypothetical protein
LLFIPVFIPVLRPNGDIVMIGPGVLPHWWYYHRVEESGGGRRRVIGKGRYFCDFNCTAVSIDCSLAGSTADVQRLITNLLFDMCARHRCV